ncbi:MAG TPA: hypothetical protein VFY17_01325 [Pilimelia sp.]|nr:hypothetical protein [Pilimelia sp.]
MRRRTCDINVTAVGAMLTVVLAVAGALAIWGYTFATDAVKDQLAEQQIFFPAKDSPAMTPEIAEHLEKYAGQQLTTGDQAYAYAEHYIKVHLRETADGKTYAQVSTESRANPADPQLKAQVETLFRGETLRGLLLNAYAFWTVGQIALWAGIASFTAAGVMLALTIAGLMHLRRVDPQEEMLAGRPPATA